MRRDEIERLFWQQVEQGKDTEQEVTDGILDALDTYAVRNEIAFHDYTRNIVEQIMDSEPYEDHLRNMEEIEYEKRHPYKSRGVSKSMFM